MEDQPIISVVMAVYNGQKYLEETIDSILSQTEKRFEFIIINDCSTDGSPEILKKYQELDSRIIVINNEVNLKLPASLNRGIRVAKGKYIARMDADDIALANRFEVQLETMEKNPDLDFIGGLVECFYDDSSINNAYADAKSMEDIHFNFISSSKSLEDTSVLIKKSTYITTRICHSTLFGKTSVFRDLMYTEDVFAEDWDLYNRALTRGYKISKVPELILKYRIVNSGMSGSFNDQKRQEILKKLKKLNNGILKDFIKNGSFLTALRFFWYHYCKAYLARIKHASRVQVRIIFIKSIILILDKFINMLSIDQLRLLKRVIDAAMRRRFILKIPLINRVILFFNKRLSANKHLIYDKIDSSEERINIGIWTIEKKWAMGGLNTIFKLIPIILANGYKIRIINYGLHTEGLKKEFYSYIIGIIDLKKEEADQIEIVSALTYRHNVTSFNRNDKFIAGFWEPAEDFISSRKLKHFYVEKFVYIIQDYEPSMLYRWGSEYIRSKATLCDLNYYPIYNNSEFVCGYMKKLGIIDGWSSSQILHGEPCITEPPSFERMRQDSRKINLVFYSRPSVDKNIYEIKIKALRLFIDDIKKNHPKLYQNMTITGIGEDCNDVLHDGFLIKNMGKVDYKEYPSLLKSFNIGLSCIISPAFAYPCIEFPRAGIVTVVNRFENRDLSIFSSNIISCDNSAESICQSLLVAVDRVSNIQSRVDGSKFNLPGVSIEVAARSMLNEIKGIG